MSETNEPTVSEELEQLRNEAEAIDSGKPLPSQAAEIETPDGGEEAEGESEEGLTEEDNSGDETVSEPDTVEDSEEKLEDAGAEVPDEGEGTGEKSDAEPSPRVGKKKAALKRSWENADRRHREVDGREQMLRQHEAELLQREQRVTNLEAEVPDDPLPKYTLDELASSLEEFIDEGDFETAKGLVKNMAAKGKALQSAGNSKGPGSKAFTEAWDQVRTDVIRANPDLGDPKTSLYREATGLLNGEWAGLFSAHPGGVAAAVEVAKLRLNAVSSSELSDKVKRLEIENKKLKKATALDGTRPTSRDDGPDKWDTMPLEEQLNVMRAEAAALS